MSSQFLPSLGEEGGRKTPSCYCWPGKVRICLNCVAGVKRGKGLEGSGEAEGWVIWYHGIIRGLNWNRQTASILCKETIIPWWNYSGYGKLVGVWGKTIFRNTTTEIFHQSGCQESPRGRTCDSTSATPIKFHFTSNHTRSVSLVRRSLMTKHIRKCSEKVSDQLPQWRFLLSTTSVIRSFCELYVIFFREISGCSVTFHMLY